jgi:hypothetical protein
MQRDARRVGREQELPFEFRTFQQFPAPELVEQRRDAPAHRLRFDAVLHLDARH